MVDRLLKTFRSPSTTLRTNGEYLKQFRISVHAETCMMDVEAHHESSITVRMAKILTIVSRRNFDGKPKVYS
jgi:hypothetical protein